MRNKNKSSGKNSNTSFGLLERNIANDAEESLTKSQKILPHCPQLIQKKSSFSEKNCLPQNFHLNTWNAVLTNLPKQLALKAEFFAHYRERL